jgi:hypothetical protein
MCKREKIMSSTCDLQTPLDDRDILSDKLTESTTSEEEEREESLQQQQQQQQKLPLPQPLSFKSLSYVTSEIWSQTYQTPLETLIKMVQNRIQESVTLESPINRIHINMQYEDWHEQAFEKWCNNNNNSDQSKNKNWITYPRTEQWYECYYDTYTLMLSSQKTWLRCKYYPHFLGANDATSSFSLHFTDKKNDWITIQHEFNKREILSKLKQTISLSKFATNKPNEVLYCPNKIASFVVTRRFFSPSLYIDAITSTSKDLQGWSFCVSTIEIGGRLGNINDIQKILDPKIVGQSPSLCVSRPVIYSVIELAFLQNHSKSDSSSKPKIMPPKKQDHLHSWVDHEWFRCDDDNDNDDILDFDDEIEHKSE